ncbi:MAG: BspA family leucine-rich repeat surface protein [Mangrovibacterium sp.]
MVGQLEIVAILSTSDDVSGGYGEKGGIVDMANIPEGDECINNHNISINMPSVQENQYFVTSWQIDADGTEITFPIKPSQTLAYDFFVDWGDGQTIDGKYYAEMPNIEHFSGTGSTLAATVKHSFAKKGTVNIRIAGGKKDANDKSTGEGFPQLYFNDAGDKDKILTVEQWGNIKWTSMENAFAGCANLQVKASDVPDLAKATNMASMFKNAKLLNFDISNWDVSTITDMSYLFSGASSFNNGDVGNLTGKPLNWGIKTAKVSSTAYMFENAASFNQSITGWNFAQLVSMEGMFKEAVLFNNGDLGNNSAMPMTFTWPSPAKLEGFKSTFQGAKSYNQTVIGLKTSKVTDFSNLFNGASLFNQPTPSTIDFSNALDMSGMFADAASYNQNIADWDISKVAKMDSMFKNAVAFDQNLSKWKISALTQAEDMFAGAKLSQQNYDRTLVSWLAQVNAGTAKEKVKFHGGASQFCLAVEARKKLIDKGWGDGVPGASSYESTDATAILDGGVNCSGQFITEWKLPADKKITIQRSKYTGPAMTVDWGDGVVNFDVTGEPTHTYTNNNVGDVVTIRMEGGVTMSWRELENGMASNLIRVVQFGDIVWTNISRLFCGAHNMTFAEDIDTPNLSQIGTNMSYIFYGCEKFNSDLSKWDVSRVVNMQVAFKGATEFNQDLSDWDVSNVTTFQGMFHYATKFNNGDKLLSWGEKTANVTDMGSMFSWARAFNQPINDWNVGNVTSMQSMFNDAIVFNQPLDKWNVSKVESFSRMFCSDQSIMAIDQDFSKWKIDALDVAHSMFYNCQLSIANYDALLISWQGQVQAATAKQNVPFHGGLSKYCAATSARSSLLNTSGWTITDAGSAAPNVSSTNIATENIFQGESGVIIITNATPGLTYSAKALPDGASFSVEATAATVYLNVGTLNATTKYQLSAIVTGLADCPSMFSGDYTIVVQQKPDLLKSTVEVSTASDKKIANGSDKHTIKVTVRDIFGALIPNANVTLASTSDVTFNASSAKTDANGVATFSASSLKTGTYKTMVSASCTNTMNPSKVEGGQISSAGNPATYTFVAGDPNCVNSTVTLATTQAIADGMHAHEFVVSLTDDNANPIPNFNITFSATADVAFYYLDANNNKISFAKGAEASMPTKADGTLKVYATSTRAWSSFETTVSFEADKCEAKKMTYQFVAGSVDLSKCTIVASPTSQIAGGEITLTITMLDTYLNPQRGLKAVFRQAQLQANGAQIDYVTYDGSVGKKELTTDDNGKASVKASSEMMGLYQTEGTAILSGVEVTNGKTVKYEFTAAAPATSKSVAELTIDNSEADNTDPNQIKATIKDQYGNLVSGAKVRIAADEKINWGSGYNTAHELTTGADGLATFNGYSNTAGTYTTVVEVETSAGVWAAINPTAGLEHHFIVSDVNFTQSEVIITKSRAIANDTDDVVATINLKNAAGQSVTSNMYIIVYKTDHVRAVLDPSSVSSGDVVSILPNGNWVVKVTYGSVTLHGFSTVAGEYKTNFGIWDNVNQQDLGIFAKDVTYSFYSGLPDAAKSLVSVSKDNAVVGNNNTLLVQLFDGFGFDGNPNPITELTEAVDVVFAATPGVSINGAAVGEAYTYSLAKGDNGTFGIPVTSEKAGSYSTAVALGGVELSGSSVKYTFKAGAPVLNKSYYEVTKNGATANNSDMVTIKAHMFDVYDNPVPSVNVRLSNEHIGEGCLTIGAFDYPEGRAVTDANGVATVNIISTAVGRYNTTVAFTPNGDWDEASFVGNELPATQGGTALKAPFYFVDQYTTVDQDKNMAIRAKWYVVQQEDASTHGNTDVRSASGLKAWYLSGAENYISTSSVDVSGLVGLNGGAVGPYQLTFKATKATDVFMERKVVASVVNANTAYSETDELAVYGEDYHLSVDQAKQHDAADVLLAANANVKAWSLSSGEDFTLSKLVPDASALASIQTGVPNTYSLPLVLTEDAKALTRLVKVTVVDDKSWFITSWNVAAGEKITIPTVGTGYDFVVEWGDDSYPQHLVDGDAFAHTYAQAGTYQIKISGNFPRLFFNQTTGVDKMELKIQSVDQWGTIKWTSMESAFAGCEKLTLNATDNPDLSNVTSMEQMFRRCLVMNSAKLNDWDVSAITNMRGVFVGAAAFNQKLDKWNVSKATNMEYLFYGAAAFNQDLSMWNVSSVTNMAHSFGSAVAFNQDLSEWNVSAVTTMEGMFEGAVKFNNGNQAFAWTTQTAHVENMASMFFGATAFDQNLGGWDISSLLTAHNMFKGAELSVTNYDALLMGWQGKTHAASMKFHGGASKFCAGANARAALVAEGWGDAVAGGNPDNSSESTTGIVDGGSAMPTIDWAWEKSLYETCVNSSINLTLSGSQQNYNYQLRLKSDQTAVGTPVAGTGAAISFPIEATADAVYDVEITNAAYPGACSAVLAADVSVKVSPKSVGGTLAVKDGAESSVCLGGEITLQLSDYVGEIVRWESSVQGDFLDLELIENNTNSCTISSVEMTKKYRVVVQSGMCSYAYSSELDVTLVLPTVGGVVVLKDETLDKAEFCHGEKIDLWLVEHLGDQCQWQQASNTTGTTPADADYTNIAGATTEYYTTEVLEATTADMYYFYRVKVKNGLCNELYSEPIKITINTPSKGGKAVVDKSEICSGNKVYLNLENQLGKQVQWQMARNTSGDNPLEADFVSISLANKVDYTSEVLQATDKTNYYFFRALISNGVCNASISEVAKVTVFVPVVAGELTADKNVIGVGEEVTFTLMNYVGNIIRWEAVDANEAVTIINHTEESYQMNLESSTHMVVVLSNGACGEEYSKSVFVKVNGLDFGDAPQTYGTTKTDNGARHYIDDVNNNLFLGTAAPDAERDGQATDDASGDDNSGDDEDALAASYGTDGSFITLTDIQVTNSTGKQAYLYGWIDLNQDGKFGEEESMTQTIELGENTVTLKTDDYNNSIKQGTYMVRMRVGTVQAEVSSPLGLAIDGEVEDHQICVYEDHFELDDIEMKICKSTSLDLSQLLHYAGSGTVSWTDSKGNEISTNYDVSHLEEGDLIQLIYKVSEQYCGQETKVESEGSLYLKVLSETELDDRNFMVCKVDASSLNLNAIMAVSIDGTWVALTEGAGAYVQNGRFNAMRAADELGVETFTFELQPKEGSCVLNAPKLIIKVVDSF